MFLNNMIPLAAWIKIIFFGVRATILYGHILTRCSVYLLPGFCLFSALGHAYAIHYKHSPVPLS